MPVTSNKHSPGSKHNYPIEDKDLCSTGWCYEICHSTDTCDSFEYRNKTKFYYSIICFWHPNFCQFLNFKFKLLAIFIFYLFLFYLSISDCLFSSTLCTFFVLLIKAVFLWFRFFYYIFSRTNIKNADETKTLCLL